MSNPDPATESAEEGTSLAALSAARAAWQQGRMHLEVGLRASSGQASQRHDITLAFGRLLIGKRRCVGSADQRVFYLEIWVISSDHDNQLAKAKISQVISAIWSWPLLEQHQGIMRWGSERIKSRN